MNIFKSIKGNQRPALLILCMLALFFVYACQCEGEIGTKANNTGSVGVTTAALDTK